MKKEWGLLISLAIVVIMGGCFIVALTDQSLYKQMEKSEKTQYSINIRKADMQSVNQVTISNEYGEYVIENLGNDFSVKGRKGVPFKKQKLEEIVQKAACVSAVKAITHKTARDCGLQPPKAQVKVDYIDKEPLVLGIGNQSGEGVYILVDNKVFLAETENLNLFLQGEKELVLLEVVPKKSPDTKIKRAVLSGSVREQPIVIEAEKDGKNYKITAPVKAVVPAERVNSKMEGFFGLYADEAEFIMPTPEQMKACEFDKPYSVIDVSTGQESYTITASQPQDGSCFVMKAGTPVIYKIKKEKLLWLDVQEDFFTAEPIQAENAAKAEQIKVSTTQQSWDFKTDKNGKTTLNEADIKKQDFDFLYKQISSIPPLNQAKQAAAASAVFAVTVVYNQESELQRDELYFYPTENDAELCLEHNGKIKYTVKRSSLEEITAACEKAWTQAEKS
ncbi:MAG: hypothetical protein IKV41_03820 [Oscillospiraceae bacterium]|nr:hypothetical protein [Oscillospiraceae bacterium]